MSVIEQLRAGVSEAADEFERLRAACEDGEIRYRELMALYNVSRERERELAAEIARLRDPKAVKPYTNRGRT